MRYLVIYAIIVVAMAFLFLRLPTSFLPDEDQGFIICQVQLPPGATEQAQRSVQINLFSQIVIGGLILAGDQERSQLAQKTLVNQQASYRLTQSRYEAGVANALALSQALSSVEAARVDIARYTGLVAEDTDALSLLMGAPLPKGFAPPPLFGSIAALSDIAPGLSSDVLLCRPDILQAENLLKGVNANIGTARDAFFPRITLVSSLGFGSSALDNLFLQGSKGTNNCP